MTDERNKPDPAPAISPELVERMVKYIRAYHQCYVSGPLYDEACAILAELEPVDPLLVEARGIAAHTRRFGREGAPYSTCSIAEKIEAGDWDDHMLVIAAMDALKRGMELAKEQGA